MENRVNEGNKDLNIQDIPIEILAIIFSFLSKSRFSLVETCILFSTIIHDIVGYVSVTLRKRDILERILNYKGVLENSNITLIRCDDILDEDLKFLSGVKSVHLYNMPHITDKGVCLLSGARDVTLYGMDNITDKGLKALKGVEHIYITSKKITNKGVKALRGLKSINISSPLVTDIGIKALAGAEKAVLGGSGVSDQGVKALGKGKKIRKADGSFFWKRVKYIDLKECPKVGASGIKGLKYAETVYLSGDHINDDCIKALRNVKYLTLSARNVTDDSIKTLSKVKEIELYGCGKVTDKGIRRLNADCIEVCKCMNISKELVTKKKITYTYCFYCEESSYEDSESFEVSSEGTSECSSTS